jgi:hypothetical protein
MIKEEADLRGSRQLKKQTQMLRQKLKEGEGKSPSRKHQKTGGREINSSPCFFSMVDIQPQSIVSTNNLGASFISSK